MHRFAAFDFVRDSGAKSKQKYGHIVGTKSFYFTDPFSAVIAQGNSDRVIFVLKNS